MQTLHIAVVPSENDKRQLKMDRRLVRTAANGRTLLLLLLDTGCPRGTPANTAKALMSQRRLMLKNPRDVMEESNLHVALRYKPAPGPDPSYRLMISKWSAQTVHVEYLCSEQTTQAAVESPCSATYFTSPSSTCTVEGFRPAGAGGTKSRGLAGGRERSAGKQG